MAEEVLAHGTRVGLDGGRVVEIVDRRGHRHARLAWRDDHLSSAMVWGALGGDPVVVSPALVAHPVLGDCHALSCGALMAAIDWAAPRRIPAIDRPDAIPAGAGTMLLDVIAMAAARAGVAALAYDGPYPTHALWASLAQCFAARGGGVDDFVAGGEVRFAPAPFERVWLDARVRVQLRAGLERASIDGRDYAIDAHDGVRRLVRDPDDAGRWAAQVWIADAPYATIARLDDRGELVSGPHPPPALAAAVIGREFPPALRDALAELVADAVPAPLAAGARAIVGAARIAWDDLGVDLARADDGGARLRVHAALWERLAPHGLARVGLAIAEALEPIVRRLAAARAAATVITSAASDPHP